MSFTSQPASRQSIIPMIFIWGGTGGGKTESALRLARGIAGPNGKICVGDTENKRSLLPFDRIDGGYDFVDFQPPFTPERYIELIEHLEKNCDVGVVDSGSHLWSGPDGILEEHEKILDRMVGNDWQKREAASWRAWNEPKMRLKNLEGRLLRCKVPLIVCFRGELKSKLVRDERGKSTIQQSETTIPIFDVKFIFEALIAFEVYQDEGGGGLIRYPFPYAKVSHAKLQAALPQPGKERLGAKHGAAIASWCAAGAVPPSAAPAVPLRPQSPAPAAAPSKVKLSDAEKVQKWKARCIQAAAGDERYAVEMAVDAGILLPNEKLDDWPVDKLPKTKEQVDFILSAISDKAGIPKNPEEIVP